MKKKLFFIFCIVYCLYCLCVPFNTERAVNHLNNNALFKSKCCCAWFVMRAIQAGGIPIGILPAWGYKYVLPFYGFANITDLEEAKVLKKGDIVVFPAIKGHPYGHIAMWNGEQWVSDFKQKNIICAKAYKNCKYQLYRNS